MGSEMCIRDRCLRILSESDRGLEKTFLKGDDELRVAPRGKVARNRYMRVRHSLRLDVNLAPKLVDRGLMLFYLLTSEMCRILE